MTKTVDASLIAFRKHVNIISMFRREKHDTFFSSDKKHPRFTLKSSHIQPK